MAYAKFDWVGSTSGPLVGSPGATPITAERLDNLETQHEKAMADVGTDIADPASIIGAVVAAKINTAAVDAKVAADINTPASATATALTATITTATVGKYAPLTSARPGNRVAFLGDSITESAWMDDFNQFASYPLFVTLLSRGRLTAVVNAGKSGDKSVQALARFDAEVTPTNPHTVVVLLGTNDIGTTTAGGSVPFATFQANIAAIVAKCRSIGAVPVLGTIPPENTALNQAVTSKWNIWLRSYAATNGLSLIDFYALLVDPATSGAYLSAYNGDGTHPNAAGYLAMGQLVTDTLSPLAPAWGPYMSANNSDAINLVHPTNSIFLTEHGTVPGVPLGWFAYGGSTGFAHALTPVAGVPGKVARVTLTAAASQRIMQRGGIPVTAGSRIAVSGVLTSSGGITAEVKVIFVGPGSAYRPCQFVAAVDRGVYYQEMTVPPGTTSVTLELICGPGTGVVEFGRPTLLNLTTLAT